MAIDKKLIHFGKLADFETQLTAGNILDRSIVFIQDAKKIWTHGTYYDCSEGEATGDSFWQEDSEGRAFCDRDVQIEGNILTNGAVVTGSIGVPSSEGYATGDKGQVLMADGNGGIAWDDLSIPTKISDLENDNVYITDFKVADVIRLKEGEIEELQIDSAALSEAIIAKKTILVPYDEYYVGGYGLLLGETADTEIYLSIYTHLGQLVYTEVYNGIVYAPITIIRDLQMESVRQLEFGTLKNIAVANAVETDGLLYAFPDQATGDEDDVILTRGTVKTINGETIYGSGDITIEGGGTAVDNVYITEFTVNKLDALIADPTLSMQADIPRMYDAMSAHKVVLVPYDSNEGFQGYGVATGYHEDLFYVTITLDNGKYIDLEVNHDSDVILGNQVRQRIWEGKQDTLVSGTNIKTINGTSLLGSGNIEIEIGEANVQSDWLETNTVLDSYVKNKTHYVAGTKITSAGSYSIGASTPIYYREKVYNLEIGVRTQIDHTAAGVYVTLNNAGILTVEGVASLLGSFPIIAVTEIVPLDDMFIPETIARKSELKTINGQSILGSGNISISGGSGGGSSAYSEVNHGTSDTTFALTPNTFHVWDEVSALTLALGSETSGVANEYLFQFTSGATATTLSLPSDLKWTDELVIEPNMIYQVSILKGLASVLSWENVAELVENKLEIVKSGKSYIINSQYPVESSLKIALSNSSISSITFPAGSSSYSIGSNPTTPSIIAIEPSEDHAYKYIW